MRKFSMFLVIMVAVMLSTFTYCSASAADVAVKQTLGLFNESMSQSALADYVSPKSVWEVAIFKCMLSFREMRNAYEKLPEASKEEFFKNKLVYKYWKKKSNSKAVLVTKILTRKSFEQLLQDEFTEIDYMSMFDIIRFKKDAQIKKAYYKELRAKKLIS